MLFIFFVVFSFVNFTGKHSRKSKYDNINASTNLFKKLNFLAQLFTIHNIVTRILLFSFFFFFPFEFRFCQNLIMYRNKMLLLDILCTREKRKKF